MRETAIPLAIAALCTLLAACAERNVQVASGDSVRCEAMTNHQACRLNLPRPDDNWRTSAFGGY